MPAPTIAEKTEARLRLLVEDAGFELTASSQGSAGGFFRIGTKQLGPVGFANVAGSRFTAIIPGRTYTHDGSELVDALEAMKKEQGS